MEISSTASSSIVGKLLEEISWERARDYRKGGQGRENVLTAEVLVGLDFLPRTEFLGGVIRSAHGASEARAALAAEAEELRMHFLPGDLRLGSGNHKGRPFVQPDAVFETPSTYTLVEAKRIRYGSFQPEQLAREYVALMSNTGASKPVFLLLGVTPPLRVKGSGLLEIHDAVSRFLGPVLDRVGDEALPSKSELLEQIPEIFCWISWEELNGSIAQALAQHSPLHRSSEASVRRIAAFVHNAIVWHG